MGPIRTKNREIRIKIHELTLKESKLNKLLFFSFKNKIGLIIILSFTLIMEAGFIFIITENPAFIGPNFRSIYTITDKLREQRGDDLTDSEKLINLNNQY